MNFELLAAIEMIEKEKNISRNTLLEAIANSLATACRTIYGKSANVKVDIDQNTCEYHVCVQKTVVEEVTEKDREISLVEARMHDPQYNPGDIYNIEVSDEEYGRIAAQNAKNVILQTIREEERKVLYNQYVAMEHEMVTGVVQRYVGQKVSVNLGRIDAMLNKEEMIDDEKLKPNDRIKVLILEVKDMSNSSGKGSSRNPRILVSRTHPDLVRRLFESEVTEVRDGTVEIKGLVREAGSRTKMAVWSNDPDVDPVGACVGINGSRVNAVVRELHGEKIDIINWNENPAILIENSLSPAKVVAVLADPEDKAARVIVPDYQLSLAIGTGGQNVRLAARLTGYKIDIRSESQADEWLNDDSEYEEYEDYDEYKEANEYDGYDGYADDADYDGYADDADEEDYGSDEE